jgi:hypothetical protein
MREDSYVNTFIAVADDCKADAGTVPPTRTGAPTVAQLQFAMLQDHPYTYSQPDVLFTVYADRAEIPKTERAKARVAFFSKGQPCLRCSPLGKTYGWGMHFNEKGNIKLVGRETAEYKRMLADSTLHHTKAMKSAR